MSCTRRDVLRGLAAGAACGAVGCGTNGGGPSPDAGSGACPSLLCVSLASAGNSALRTTGGALTFTTPNDTIIVIRVDTNTVAALSDICTHAGCALDYNSGNGYLVCPCHGSVFDLMGAVVRGPAGTPIKAYTATLAADTIDVSG